MARRRQFKPTLGVALREAGVRVRRCRVHGDLWPCMSCKGIFDGAERQRMRQTVAEVKALRDQCKRERGR